VSSEHTGDFLLGWTAAGVTDISGKEPVSRRARIQKKEQGDCSCWASELDDRGSWFRRTRISQLLFYAGPGIPLSDRIRFPRRDSPIRVSRWFMRVGASLMMRRQRTTSGIYVLQQRRFLAGAFGLGSCRSSAPYCSPPSSRGAAVT